MCIRDRCSPSTFTAPPARVAVKVEGEHAAVPLDVELLARHHATRDFARGAPRWAAAGAGLYAPAEPCQRAPHRLLMLRALLADRNTTTGLAATLDQGFGARGAHAFELRVGHPYWALWLLTARDAALLAARGFVEKPGGFAPPSVRVPLRAAADPADPLAARVVVDCDSRRVLQWVPRAAAAAGGASAEGGALVGLCDLPRVADGALTAAVAFGGKAIHSLADGAQIAELRWVPSLLLDTELEPGSDDGESDDES